MIDHKFFSKKQIPGFLLHNHWEHTPEKIKLFSPFQQNNMTNNMTTLHSYSLWLYDVYCYAMPIWPMYNKSYMFLLLLLWGCSTTDCWISCDHDRTTNDTNIARNKELNNTTKLLTFLFLSPSQFTGNYLPMWIYTHILLPC